jgi:hypothetical protein
MLIEKGPVWKPTPSGVECLWTVTGLRADFQRGAMSLKKRQHHKRATNIAPRWGADPASATFYRHSTPDGVAETGPSDNSFQGIC